jgi:hypothetical protein
LGAGGALQLAKVAIVRVLRAMGINRRMGLGVVDGTSSMIVRIIAFSGWSDRFYGAIGQDPLW